MEVLVRENGHEGWIAVEKLLSGQTIKPAKENTNDIIMRALGQEKSPVTGKQLYKSMKVNGGVKVKIDHIQSYLSALFRHNKVARELTEVDGRPSYAYSVKKV
jgi:pentatricopeptide repeat protein